MKTVKAREVEALFPHWSLSKGAAELSFESRQNLRRATLSHWRATRHLSVYGKRVFLHLKAFPPVSEEVYGMLAIQEMYFHSVARARRPPHVSQCQAMSMLERLRWILFCQYSCFQVGCHPCMCVFFVCLSLSLSLSLSPPLSRSLSLSF